MPGRDSATTRPASTISKNPRMARGASPLLQRHLIVNHLNFARQRFVIKKNPPLAVAILHGQTSVTIASNPNWYTLWRLMPGFLILLAMRSIHDVKHSPD